MSRTEKSIDDQIKENHPKDYEKGFCKGESDYDKGLSPKYQRYYIKGNYCKQMEWESLAYNCGYSNGMYEARKKDIATNAS